MILLCCASLKAHSTVRATITEPSVLFKDIPVQAIAWFKMLIFKKKVTNATLPDHFYLMSLPLEIQKYF